MRCSIQRFIFVWNRWEWNASLPPSCAGHEVRLIDLQVFNHRELQHELQSFQPDAVGFSVNYLANVPEVIDLARLVREILPKSFIFCGGHSISFIADEVLAHGDGAIDAIVTGEGETDRPSHARAHSPRRWNGRRCND